MMWKLSLYILWAASLFALALADLGIRQDSPPLNSCILTVWSTTGNAADPQTVITYGALNRFAISTPSVNPLVIAGGGTSDYFEDLGNSTYRAGFSVTSREYGLYQLTEIVTQQWPGTFLFDRDVGTIGNWKVLSVDC